MNDLHEQFPQSLVQLEQYVPIINDIAATEKEDKWQFLKQQDGVNIYRLLNPITNPAFPMPHMVKGVGVVPLSLAKFYEYMIKLSFDNRKQFDNLLEVWNIADHLSENNRNQLYLYNTVHQPPTRFMSRREFVFLGQTYVYDREGVEIPLPKTANDSLETWMLENSAKIQKVLMITHSVNEDEILRSRHASAFVVDHNRSVRGRIHCIANVLEQIDDHSCKAQLLCDMDVGGRVPDFVKGIIAQYNPTSFIKMKSHLDVVVQQQRKQ